METETDGVRRGGVVPPSFGVILVVRFKIRNSRWGDGEIGVDGHQDPLVTLLVSVASSTAPIFHSQCLLTASHIPVPQLFTFVKAVILAKS